MGKCRSRNIQFGRNGGDRQGFGKNVVQGTGELGVSGELGVRLQNSNIGGLFVAERGIALALGVSPCIDAVARMHGLTLVPRETDPRSENQKELKKAYYDRHSR